MEPAPTSVVDQFEATLRQMTPRVMVTYLLLAANLAVFGIMIASGVHWMSPTIASLLTWGADYGPKTLAGEWWRMITCTFVHIGLFHIAMNMIVLVDAGRLVERLLGNAGFAVLSRVSGIGGSLASLWWSPQLVSAGASGAVFGIYGALLAVIVREGKSIPQARLQRLTRSAVGFVGYNVVFGLQKSGIDMAAHLGGIATGFLCGLVLSRAIRGDSRERWPELAGVAALGVALIFGAPRILPHDGGDSQAELERFEQVEKQCFDTYNKALDEARAGKLSDEQVADILEQKVLPPWKSSRERIQALKGMSKTMKARIDKVVAYMVMREEGWALLAKGGRAHDAELVKQASALQQEAEALAKSLASDD